VDARETSAGVARPATPQAWRRRTSHTHDRAVKADAFDLRKSAPARPGRGRERGGNDDNDDEDARERARVAEHGLFLVLIGWW